MEQWEFCNVYLVAGKISVIYFGKETKAMQYEEEKYEELMDKLKQTGWEPVEGEEMDAAATGLIMFKRPVTDNKQIM